MQIVDNSKQNEFLMKIRDVGMSIIFKRTSKHMILENFAPFVEFIEDQEAANNFAKSVIKLEGMDSYTPDELLLELGQYTPYIIYDDNEVEESPLYDDDEGWFWK